MTYSEFKYWLEGFEYLFKEQGYPDVVQWAEIKGKLANVYDYSDVGAAKLPYTPTVPAMPDIFGRPYLDTLPAAGRLVADMDPTPPWHGISDNTQVGYAQGTNQVSLNTQQVERVFDGL